MKKRNLAIDFLRFFAILGVVGNHLYYPIFSRPDFFGGLSWWISLVIYSISVIAVPLFIIISGYLLIEKEESLSKTYTRLFKRLVIPLIFWFAFYIYWKEKFRVLHISPAEIVESVLSGSMFFYYFLVILIGLYALLPIVRLIAKYGSLKLKRWLLLASFVLGFLMYCNDYFSGMSGTVLSLSTRWLPYFGYFWFGYMIKNSKLRYHSKRFSLLFILSFIFTLLAGYIGLLLAKYGLVIAMRDGIYYWHSYLSPVVIIMSTSFFASLIHAKSLKKIIAMPLLSKLLQLSIPLVYGVYLIHIYVIDWIDIKHRYAIEFVETSLLEFVIMKPILTLSLSFGVIWVLSKIPFLRKVIGLS